jgi:hypothetical protein
MRCSADFAKNCPILALPRLVKRLSLEMARKLSMQSVPNDRAHKTKDVSRHRGDNVREVHTMPGKLAT